LEKVLKILFFLGIVKKGAQPFTHTNAHAKSIRVNYLKYKIAMNKLDP